MTPRYIKANTIALAFSGLLRLRTNMAEPQSGYSGYLERLEKCFEKSRF